MKKHAGTILVTNVGSDSVTLINEEHPEVKINLPVGKHPHEVVVTPNGKYALVGNYGDLTGQQPGDTLTSIDIVKGEVLETIQIAKGSRPHGIAFMSDHRALVTAQGIQSLLVVEFDDDFKHGKVVNTIKLPCAGAHMVTVNSDKTDAYVGCFSGFVCKVNVSDPLAENMEVKAQKIGHHAAGIALTRDEKLLLATNMNDSQVAVISTSDMTLMAKIDTKLGPTRVSLCNDGKSALIIDSIAGKLQILDLATLTIANTFASTNTRSYKTGKFMGGFFGSLPVPTNTIIDEDQIAYVSNLYAGNVTQVDLKDGKILKTFEAECEPDGISISPFKSARL